MFFLVIGVYEGVCFHSFIHSFMLCHSRLGTRLCLLDVVVSEVFGSGKLWIREVTGLFVLFLCLFVYPQSRMPSVATHAPGFPRNQTT